MLVAQSCPTLSDPMDCSQPGSSVHGFLQARILEWIAIPFFIPSPGDVPDLGIEPRSPALQADSSPSQPPRKPIDHIPYVYYIPVTYRLPRWLSGKESTCQCRRCGFDPWVGKIPCRRKWQPTPVFLLGKSHGQRSLAGHSLWGRKESDITEQLSMAYFLYNWRFVPLNSPCLFSPITHLHSGIHQGVLCSYEFVCSVVSSSLRLAFPHELCVPLPG